MIQAPIQFTLLCVILVFFCCHLSSSSITVNPRTCHVIRTGSQKCELYLLLLFQLSFQIGFLNLYKFSCPRVRFSAIPAPIEAFPDPISISMPFPSCLPSMPILANLIRAYITEFFPDACTLCPCMTRCFQQQKVSRSYTIIKQNFARHTKVSHEHPR